MSRPTTAPTQPEIREDTRPQIGTGDGDHDRFAHYVRRSDQMRGYVLGEAVVALCGKKWIPTRDPDRYPICPTCKELFVVLRGSEE